MKTNINLNKDKLRKQIAEAKQKYSPEELTNMSYEVLSVLEITGKFNDAKKICIYNAISGEVETQSLVNEWSHEKEFYHPVVKGDDLVIRKIDKETTFEKSSIGIYEPIGEDFEDYDRLDLIIIPGVAFDRKGNRLGRGKGYYDRFLSKTNATKIGICFDFQLFDNIPVNEKDIAMDMIVSENDLIW